MIAKVRRYDTAYGLVLNPRYDDQYGVDSQTPQPDSGASRDRIIIGVVVGGVATIAISADAAGPVTVGIFFILLKKRKWDRIRRYEEQLLVMRASSSAEYNKAQTVTPEPYSTASQRPVSINISKRDHLRKVRLPRITNRTRRTILRNILESAICRRV
ncbi:hypothetical protein BDV59DRAFT_203997 [Aspergillus ambiguus]|uniref:uncharacterized protein n=1 Tax=Aspergillus ambiguus TaxID=176160 RepID=UPI003CCE1415